MSQNFLPLDGSIPSTQPLRDPMNFQVGYAREPTNLGVHSDPVGLFNTNTRSETYILPATSTTTTTKHNLIPYCVIGVVLYLLMRPKRY
jgi:hypothetical protein